MNKIARPQVGTCSDCREDDRFLTMSGRCYSCFGTALTKHHQIKRHGGKPCDCYQASDCSICKGACKLIYKEPA